MAKKQSLITFRVDDRFNDWLGRQILSLDTDASKLIRMSLMLAIPQIKACPTLLERVVDDDFRLESD